MKYAALPAAIVALVFTFAPASAHMMSCSEDMSRMTAMMTGMPDGPHKWEMNKHLAMLNAAMARDGTRVQRGDEADDGRVEDGDDEVGNVDSTASAAGHATAFPITCRVDSATGK